MGRKSEKSGTRRYPAHASERTSFVGREDDLGELARLFGGEARLVSVVGPPGMGKTRLALRFFRGWEEGECPAFFCDVREAESPAELASAVARVLSAESLSGSEGDEWVAQLGGMLDAHGRCLLVLDNFEQLVPVAAATLGRWLAAAPELRVLVTSRRILRLTGEHVRDLVPLSVRGVEEEMAAPGECGEALRLFADRASSVSSFAWDSASDDIREATVRLVRLLEGIPLALELAAGQLRRATPYALETKLKKELLSLSSVWADVDPRHATLRAAIEGSWRLLTSVEQSAVCQLTVFRGGFSIDAATTVLHLDRAVVEDVLVALRDASLLRESDAVDDRIQRRWEMYASIREYAEEKLAEVREERAAVRARHATYFVSYSRRQVARLQTRDEPDARRELKSNVSNLEAAFRWASDSPTLMHEDLHELALALNAVYERVLPGRAAEWISRSLAFCSRPGGQSDCDETVVYRVRLLLARARAQREVGEYKAATADLNEVTGLLSVLVPNNAWRSSLEALCRFEQGVLAFKQGEIDTARTLLEQACEAAEGAGTTRLAALAWTRLGFLTAEALGEPIAFDHYERALGLARKAGDERARLLATHCYELHKVHFARVTEAGPQFAVIRAARELGERWLEANGWLALGLYWHDRGDYGQTRDCYREGEETARRAGLKYTVASAVLLRALLADSLDQSNEALALLDDAAVRYQVLGALRVEGWVRVCRSGIMASLESWSGAEREWARGYKLLVDGHDRALLEAANIHRGRFDAARARRALGEGRFDESERCRRRVQSLLEMAKETMPGRECGRLGSDSAPVDRSIAARLAVRRLQLDLTRLATVGGIALRVAMDGSSFQVGSRREVTFARGSVIRRALIAFSRARRDSPGRALTTDDLLKKCWPGETPVRDSGETRVRGVVRRLRRAGLEALLVTTEQGYLLDPSVDLTLVNSGSHQP